jgi:hypothetical protein
MKTLLWLDDIRNPYKPNAFKRCVNWLFKRKVIDWQAIYFPSYDKNDKIVWVKNYEQFVNYIEKNGLPNQISLDHDLGSENFVYNVKKTRTNPFGKMIGQRVRKSGYDCCKWLIDYCQDNDKNLIDVKFTFQTSNVVGKENMSTLLINFNKFSLARINKN